MQVKDENFITIQGFMRTKLNLKGNDLLVYAIIFGYSQTENQRFTGSLQHLADWCGATKHGIIKNLNNLLDRNLIIKENTTINGVNYVTYRVTELHTMQLSYPNNIYNISTNVDINTNTNVLVQPQDTEQLFLTEQVNKPKSKNLFDKCIDAINEFTDDTEVRELLVDYLKIRLERKDIPLGINTFKGVLKKLRTLTDSKSECIKIIWQSIDRKYPTFYPLTNYKRASSVEIISAGEKKGISDNEREEIRRLVESGELKEY